MPVNTAAVAAAAGTAGSGSDRPPAAGDGLAAVQPLPSPAAASQPAAVSLPMALPRQPSEYVPSLEPSHVSLPMTTADSLPDSADISQPVQSSSPAAHVQLPSLSPAEAPPARPAGSSATTGSWSAAAPEPTAVGKGALQNEPEPPALAAHMMALAEAEELERSLLAGNNTW